MVPEDWQVITVHDHRDMALAAPWLLVLEAFGDATHLRVAAEGEWRLFGAQMPPCGPDGYSDLWLPPDRLSVAGAPAGALIGKIGGSSAGRADGSVFAIGSLCVAAVPEKAVGPLFIGVNGAAPGPTAVLSHLKLVVSGARPSF